MTNTTPRTLRDGAQTRACSECGLQVRVVNYGVERGREVGYLGRHWRPGIRRDAKCRGSFGSWEGKR